MQNLDFLEELNEQQESAIQGGLFFGLEGFGDPFKVDFLGDAQEPITTAVGDLIAVSLGLAPASSSTSGGGFFSPSTQSFTPAAVSWSIGPITLGFGFYNSSRLPSFA